MDAERTSDEADETSGDEEAPPGEGDPADQAVEKGGDGHQAEPPVAGPAGS